MEARAIAKYVNISPQKTRVVAANIKGKPVEDAVNILKFTASTRQPATLKIPEVVPKNQAALLH